MSPIRIMAIANFLFISSYALLGLNAVFFPLNQAPEIQKAVYLGMGVFGASQVGSVWLLDRIKKGFSTSNYLLILSRIASSLLILIPSPALIVLSYLLLGLSNAIFYKRSRRQLAHHLESSLNPDASPYVVFSLTTNVSYMLLPLLGSFLLAQNAFYELALLLNLVITLAAMWSYQKVNAIMPLPEQADEESSGSSDSNLKSFMIDSMRLAGFLLPYAVLMALVPIKVNQLGLASSYSSSLFTLNAAAVVIFQLVLRKLSFFHYNLRRYEWSLLASILLCIVAIIGNYPILAGAFVLWSFLEAYQLPTIEYHIFKVREYTHERLNQILGLDAIVCLVGPLIASVLIGSI